MEASSLDWLTADRTVAVLRLFDAPQCGVDLLAAPSFKWMFSPLGAGFLYVCPELIETCDPPLPGWFGVVNPGDNDLHEPKWHRSAHKFERGVPAMIAFGTPPTAQIVARWCLVSSRSWMSS